MITESEARTFAALLERMWPERYECEILPAVPRDLGTAWKYLSEHHPAHDDYGWFRLGWDGRDDARVRVTISSRTKPHVWRTLSTMAELANFLRGAGLPFD